jgi:hypothetical protein
MARMTGFGMPESATFGKAIWQKEVSTRAMFGEYGRSADF